MILRTCICVPTYNNPNTVGQVVSDCLRLTRFPVLVIDDGSTVPVSRRLVAEGHKEAQASGRLRVLRFEENQGKGAALQAAFQDCIRRGFTHALTLDGDGQHLASEVQKLLSVARESPWDLIIGSRKFSGDSVPGVSRFGRGFSNFWVRFQTSLEVSDSQSGYRVYPLFHVQNLKFWTKRFDFEIEVLIRLLWRGVSVREVEVDVYYPPKADRVSHFDKFWDNVRISCLNTLFVILSLLRSNRSPVETAMTLGLGVWIGCTPFFGFHAPIAAAFAFLFRLNFIYLFVGTQISIPPVAPLLFAGSMALSPIEASFPVKWLTGSLIFGGLLGAFTAAMALLISRGFRRSKAGRALWNGKSRGGVLGNWILKQILKRLGLRAAYFCLHFIIPYFYLFAPKARRSCNEYWSTLRPDLGFFKRQVKVLSHLLTFGKTLMDRVYEGFYPGAHFKTNPNGRENILEPVHSKRGLVLLTAHVGGWDLAAAELKTDGMRGEFHMVHYEAQGMTFNKIKGSPGPEYVKSLVTNQEQSPVLKIREILSEGRPVGLMGDRPLANHFELVPFLGKLAPFDITPFRIAAACGVPLLFTFGFKGEGQTYDFYATPSRVYRYMPDLSRHEQHLAWVAEFARCLEQFVRKYPDQWFNFFPFWSSAPSALEDIEAARARNHLQEEGHRPPMPESEWVPVPGTSVEPRSLPT